MIQQIHTQTSKQAHRCQATQLHALGKRKSLGFNFRMKVFGIKF